VRDGFRRGKSSGSVGVDGEGEEDESGLEDGLERLMSNGSDGGGKERIAMSRWRVQPSGGGLDGEVDQDSDWTRSKGTTTTIIATAIIDPRSIQRIFTYSRVKTVE
jgi:hypothetical protein